MSYKTRMLNSRDPRYQKIARKLYRTRDLVAAPPARPAAEEDIAEVRAQYQRVVGKKPFNGWDIATLREKMNAVSQAPDAA